jgi:hypothetical protein
MVDDFATQPLNAVKAQLVEAARHFWILQQAVESVKKNGLDVKDEASKECGGVGRIDAGSNKK